MPKMISKLSPKDYTRIICFCHRNENRSIKFLGLEKYFCSRCLGILFGGIIGTSLHFFDYHIPFISSIILVAPLLIDGLTQFLNVRQSNNLIRFFTGILFGSSLNYVGVLV